MFRFKQFSVDQAGCAMKINTDGVLLGALTESENLKSILDIGTGTGVISLMLAQRFSEARIDAVDIDEQSATIAHRNFSSSPFSDRLKSYHASFEDFFLQYPDRKYDLIISNPPFFLNSLKNPDPKKKIARHTDKAFFENLISFSSSHLSDQGSLWLILPLDMATLCTSLAVDYGLYPDRLIHIRSSQSHAAHRNIISFARKEKEVSAADFIIYQSDREFTPQYQAALEPFFIIF